MRHQIVAVLSLVVLVGCGGGHGPDPVPTAITYVLSGQVVNSATAFGIANATVEILDGPDVGKSVTTTTDGLGIYRFASLSPGKFTVRARAQSYMDNSQGVTLTGDTKMNFGLIPVPQL